MDSSCERSTAVRSEQIKLLYTNSLFAFTLTVLNALILVFIEWNVVSHTALVAWLCYILALTLVRVVLVRGFYRLSPSTLETNRWGTLFLVGTAFSGVGWGAAGIWLFPDDSIVHQVFVAFVLGGMTAGAVATLSSMMAAFLSFAIPALLPVIVRFLAHGGALSTAMGWMVALFMILLVFIAWKLHETILMSLQLRFENREVIASVTAGKAHMEKLNSELTAEVAERTRSVEALRQSEEQLRQSQKMEAIGKLAGGIAHDFNNLLTIIVGYCAMLRASLPKGAPARSHVEMITHAGEKATGLTRQLLAFSRKQMLQPKVLNLNAVVTNIESMLQHMIGEHIHLVSVLEPTLSPVMADPGQIEQVILNLAVNARDAMPQGGALTIETANVALDKDFADRHAPIQPGRYVMLAVSDTGCGIDVETRVRIFEPFFTTKEQGQGTGLGLSTVYGIVKQSGGYIWVFSESGHGATFKIYLPQVHSTVEGSPPSMAPAESPCGTETILLVEDEATVRQLVMSMLQPLGYTVLQASNGIEAQVFDAEYSVAIDLLITDVVMPQISGRQVAEHLKSSRPDMKVLFISGYTDNAIVHHGVLDAGVAFLQKPFTPDVLARKVREVLDGPRQR